MKRLIIIGAGGFGREVLGWAMDTQRIHNDWKVAGFLDSNPSALDNFACSVPLLGDPMTYSASANDVFVCAIGDPIQRLELCRSLEGRHASFVNVIHPTAVVGPSCQLGEGTILCPTAVVTTSVILGRHVILNVGACVGHDVRIGDGCTLNPHCDVGGFARLGEGVLLGSHADILPSAVVGDYARVGAGSVVLKKVEPRTSVWGVPAQRIF